MKKYGNYFKIAALTTGLLLTTQLATIAERPLFEQLDSIGVIAQTDESAAASPIEEKAGKILRQMSDFLEAQEKFAFSAETERDILTTTGVYLQVAHESDVIVNRPNQFRVTTTGDLVQREFWYDGERVSVVDRERNIYASDEAPVSMDETLDALIQKLNVNMPLAELLYSDIYEGLTKNVQYGYYVSNLSEVDGVPCHHLVFVQDSIDWQVWIEDSETPLLRKVAIAYKEREGVPRYTATLSDWNLNPEIAAGQFSFSPSADAKEVEFVGATPY